jgi:hypothetical protein
MEKKNTGLIVLVIVLSLLVVGLGGFIVYDKVLSNNEVENNYNSSNNDSNVSSENDGVLWINDESVKELYNMVVFYDGYYYDTKSPYYNSWYFYENKDVDLNNISNDTKLNMACARLEANDKIKNENDSYYFNASDLELELKKIFGEDVKYELSKTVSGIYDYNETTKRYVRADGLGGGGDGTAPVVKHELYKAVKNGDEIILYEKFAYAKVEIINNGTSSKLKIYKDLNKKNIINEDMERYYDGGYYYGYDRIRLSDYYDKISMVKYTFKKGNDNSYYFSSSKIVDNF